MLSGMALISGVDLTIRIMGLTNLCLAPEEPNVYRPDNYPLRRRSSGAQRSVYNIGILKHIPLRRSAENW